MDIQKEKIKQEFWNWAKVENPRMVENAELGDVYAIQNLDHMFMGFAAAKSQAVPEWKDYSQQSPRIDGRYQIFINGEQLAADWKSPFGFADPIEGVALIQDLITHWAALSADPVIMEQSNEH